MKVWTYLEASTKIITDLDLEDETFISPNELIGYFNEGILEAASEIYEFHDDYFLTKYFVPLVTGTGQYTLPSNIYANKIRGIMYVNGATIYPIKQFRNRGKFEEMAYVDAYGSADYYRYHLVNNGPGQALMEIHPVSRDTAILPPSASAFTPAIMWYIRNVGRIPVLGEYCNPELVNPSQVSTGSNNIQTYAGSTTVGNAPQGIAGGWPGSIAYVTGDAIQFVATTGGTLPAPLVAGTTYYVIASGAGVIKIASTLANALVGTAITITTVGAVSFLISVAATTNIVNAVLLDIPEFSTFVMQWAKCRCMEKEGDPRLDAASATLVAQKKQMIDSLTNAIPDNDDEIQADFSTYREMS
jgi:hypothetical protein